MRVLLAYATYSSGTDLASQVVADVLTSRDIAVERKDIRLAQPEELKDYDLVIFASPSWRTRKGDGYPHEFFLDFMDSMADKKVEGQRFAVFGLGDTAYTHFCGAVGHLEEFVQEIGGALIMPSLKIDGFYFDQLNSEDRLRSWGEELAKTLAA